VPYWWNRKYESLAATVYTQRPDLFTFPIPGIPIPLSPPTRQEKSKSESKKTLFIALINLADSTKKVLMTSTLWDESRDPKGWYMTEKFDGMRLYWNGREFFTRQGKIVKVPDSIKSKMPSVSLDGELW
jgi:ATP-dependent DNA ligase